MFCISMNETSCKLAGENIVKVHLNECVGIVNCPVSYNRVI